MTQILGQYCINVRDIDKLLSSGREFASYLFNTELKYRAFLKRFGRQNRAGHVSIGATPRASAPIDMGTAMSNICQHIRLSKGLINAIDAGCGH